MSNPFTIRLRNSGVSIGKTLLISLFTALLVACGGGGGGSGEAPGVPNTPVEPPTSPPATPMTQAQASRLLSQATFGPSLNAIDALVEEGAEQWFLRELEKPPTKHLQHVLDSFGPDGQFLDERGNVLESVRFSASDSFWEVAITADDQLRQRMAFALSQILVVSANSNLFKVPQTVAHYMDTLTEGAFGNYRDLLEAVTYSPAMSIYLTYIGNQKADPETGRVPDENYARELLQLFTLGLVALNADGTPALDENGNQQELYDNGDITELAKVFTGFYFSGVDFGTPIERIPLAAYYSPMEISAEFHSPLPKRVVGTQIPAGTGGDETVRQALDAIFAHPNVGPFLARQLIQRFVTSAPEPAYVARVAAAFDSGEYQLPSGTTVGQGERGDLQAVIAAVLFDPQARDEAAAAADTFGKLREPVIRFTHWARAFNINSADATYELALKDTGASLRLGQHPYRSPSVFNFYRPGYIAPGTETGAAGLTAPELQITTAASLVGYANYITLYTLGESPQVEREGAEIAPAYRPDFSAQLALADDTEALLDQLDTLLTFGQLRDTTRERIAAIIDEFDMQTPEQRLLRVRLAIVMVMTAPEYIVQR